jgi:hypothetical protein
LCCFFVALLLLRLLALLAIPALMELCEGFAEDERRSIQHSAGKGEREEGEKYEHEVKDGSDAKSETENGGEGHLLLLSRLQRRKGQDKEKRERRRGKTAYRIGEEGRRFLSTDFVASPEETDPDRKDSLHAEGVERSEGGDEPGKVDASGENRRNGGTSPKVLVVRVLKDTSETV